MGGCRKGMTRRPCTSGSQGVVTRRSRVRNWKAEVKRTTHTDVRNDDDVVRVTVHVRTWGGLTVTVTIVSPCVRRCDGDVPTTV